MKLSRYSALSAILISVLLLGSNIVAKAGQHGQETDAAPIYLKVGVLYPNKSLNGLDVERSTELGLDAEQDGFYIIQFRGPLEQEWKDALTALGIEILEYIPDFAFKVRGTLQQAQLAQHLPDVNWVGSFLPAYKLAPDLKRDGVNIYRVQFEDSVDLRQLVDRLAALGDTVQVIGSNTLLVAVDDQFLDDISRITDVAWIENYVIYELSRAAMNDSSGGEFMGANVAHALGYDGSTQVIAVTDTGLGGGTAATAHADIPPDRVAAIYNWVGSTDICFQTIVDDGSVDVDSGHGTHVAGSALSDGSFDGVGLGIAPGAQLVFQSTESYVNISFICQVLLGLSDGYYLTGIPADLQQIFQQSYNAGARIHSNSWGSASAGEYTVDSVNVDQFVWDNRDMLITFAAGNAGIDADSDGMVDNDSLNSPATAKNVLTVGASEGQRSDYFPCDTSLDYTDCAVQGGLNDIFSWGEAWPSDFPANPLRDDLSAGNAAQVAAFSSRGPTDDGRVKPDVVAPGTWILSTYSDLYQQGYDASPNPTNGAWQYDGYGYPYSNGYKYMSGTSMSTPLTAGGAAVVRDYYQKVHGIAASAALIKATLINSAVDLLDENNDGANDNDFPIPNTHEGWGMVNLAVATDGSIQFLENMPGLNTGSAVDYQITTNGDPLKVTVVWTDYPSTEAASVNLVNDLDLIVTAPGGAVYRGNVFSNGWSTTGGGADRRNNVENVYIQSPAAGTYTLQVHAYNIPNGPQAFALVVDGGTFGSVVPSDTPTLTSTFTSTPTNDIPEPSSTYTPSPTYPPTDTHTPVPTRTSTVTSTPSPTSDIVTTGWLSASANQPVTSNSGDNNGYESNPANAYADDGVYAADNNSGTRWWEASCSSIRKDRHLYHNYNIDLPSSVSVNGIEVRLDAHVDSWWGSPKICVFLSWDGGTTWTAAKTTSTLSTSEATYILGSSVDPWGHDWTSAQLNNNNFLVLLTDVANSTSRDFRLDYVGVRLTYNP